ncbi:hypothetical protein EVAR_12421_1 [Eumeta japonica]|uniref:Uncharacterized protein n=1 Tax=Eumeta variegata TaxID=151549 RepID=A0A4C1TZG7_EUMVA|nr:hypothetical protein EVAR_12421_1 [Eumeta japonica]
MILFFDFFEIAKDLEHVELKIRKGGFKLSRWKGTLERFEYKGDRSSYSNVCGSVGRAVRPLPGITFRPLMVADTPEPARPWLEFTFTRQNLVQYRQAVTWKRHTSTITSERVATSARKLLRGRRGRGTRGTGGVDPPELLFG